MSEPSELRTGTPEEAGLDPARIERARSLVAGWMKEGYSPAVSLLVARRGVIALEEAWGVQGPEPGAAPLRTDHIFPVASITKPVVATVLMSLVDDGVIAINRPVCEALPEFSGGGKENVTLHHLVTHCWGENFEEIFPAVVAADPAKYEPKSPSAKKYPGIHRVLTAIFDTPLRHPPGKTMEYGAMGYMLIAEVMERVTGRSLEDLVQERLFDPLGMGDSSLVVPEAHAGRIVTRAPELPFGSPNMLGLVLGSPEQQSFPAAAGGLYSTPRDLAVFGQTFLNGGEYGGTRILSKASVEQMTRNQIPGKKFSWGPGEEVGDASMGYGWFVENHEKWRPMGSLNSPGTLNHMGVGTSIVWMDRERQLVGVWCEVIRNVSEDFEPRWDFDLFQNVVVAAVR